MTQRAAGKRHAIPRVLRKARRAELTELDRRFNAELAVLRRKTQETKEKARGEYESKVETARHELHTAFGKAEKEYEQARVELLKRLEKEAPRVEEPAQ